MTYVPDRDQTTAIDTTDRTEALRALPDDVLAGMIEQELAQAKIAHAVAAAVETRLPALVDGIADRVAARLLAALGADERKRVHGKLLDKLA